MNKNERILTSAEISEKLQVHFTTILRYIKTGQLKATKMGGKWIVKESDFEEFLNRGTIENYMRAEKRATITSKFTELYNGLQDIKDSLPPDVLTSLEELKELIL